MTPALPRGRRVAIRVLLVAGTVLMIVAIFAVWVNRQALNAENWSATSSEMLDDPAIRSQVAAYLVDEVYANVDVTAEVREALPPRLAPLAGPAANGLRQLATRTTETLLGRPRVQAAWETANRLTAEQLIRIADGESRAITASGGAVFLDLRVILLEVVARLGLPGRLAGQLPPESGRIKVMSASQVDTVTNGVTALRAIAFVLPVLAFGAFALAVFLATGHRRRTLLWVGIDLVLAGVAALVLRNVAGDEIVGLVAKTEAVEPSAAAAWAIGTGMLRDVAQAVIIAGIPVLLAALLAGPTRPATAVRRALAPALRDRPGAVYATAAAIMLLVVAWGPIPATRKVIPVLIMAGLFALGVAALRRQTAEEFPDARAGEGLEGLRRRVGGVWASRGHAVPASSAAPAPQAAPASPASGDAAPAPVVDGEAR